MVGKNKIGKKGKEKWYPTHAPHIILGTNKSILDYIYYGNSTEKNKNK